MRKGVQVKSDSGYRYVIECRLCLTKWVKDVPVGTLADVLGDHDCAYMAEAKRNAGRNDYRMLVFGVHSVLWNADPKGYHPCGPKCESAKGHSCHCECRGQKHGVANMPHDPVTPEAYGHEQASDAEVSELFRRLGPEGRSDMWTEAHDRKSRRVGKNGI